MTFRTRGLYLLIPVLLALSACTAAGGSAQTSSIEAGAIEVAVTNTCAEAADSQCVVVNGENIELPSSFERAGVETAAAAQNEGQSAVNVTFTDDGAAMLHRLTEQAVGGTARLVMKVKGEIISAAAVMGPVEGHYIQIGLAPEDSAQKLVDSILEA